MACGKDCGCGSFAKWSSFIERIYSDKRLVFNFRFSFFFWGGGFQIQKKVFEWRLIRFSISTLFYVLLLRITRLYFSLFCIISRQIASFLYPFGFIIIIIIFLYYLSSSIFYFYSSDTNTFFKYFINAFHFFFCPSWNRFLQKRLYIFENGFFFSFSFLPFSYNLMGMNKLLCRILFFHFTS